VFEKEFNSAGPEKSDGYTFANFDNMTPAEKAKAADMLAGELPSFFAAADALAYFDPARCESEIRKTLSQKTPNEQSRAFHLYFVLWQITDEEDLIDQILEIGRSGQVDLTSLLSDVADLPSSAKVLAFIEDVIKQHPNDQVVELAASQLIDRYDVLSDDEVCNSDSMELMRGFTSQQSDEKQKILLKLKNQFSLKIFRELE
jgi:hypothetical protein